MSDIGKAYVQIIPKAEGISGKISGLIAPGAKDAGEKAGKEGGSGLVSGLKGTIAKLAIGGTIAAGFKTAIDEGAKLQQSFGGIDTLYGNVTESAAAAGMSVKEYMEVHGNAADKMKQFAMEAAKAGISANDYAEQAVSFGASLKQAFGGDATKAAEAANTAILDMADNAAKMGTPIENIQTAYQGFAKQNYTMLDNLKLGYGGTKGEMERLLTDAQKLSGVEYNIDNLGDVYEAIHVIQEDLGLTGVAAAEASETFSGSFEAMKAAAANLAGNLALGEDIGPSIETLIGSIGTFVFGNFIPMVGRILVALPEAIGTAFATAGPVIAEKIPELITTAKDLVTTKAPELLTSGLELVQNIGQGIVDNIPTIVDKGKELLTGFLGMITANLPTILENGKTIVFGLVDGIIANIPAIISGAGDMITKFISFITSNLPTIAAKGGEFLRGMATRIISAIPSVISAIAKLIPKVVVALGKLLPVAVKAAWNMIKSIASGIKDGWDNIKPAITDLIDKVKNKFEDMKEALHEKMKQVMNKVVDVWTKIKEKAQEIWEGVKSAITSPIEKAKELVDNAVSKIKGIFPISMGKIFSGIELPHFKISGGSIPWGIGGQGTKPSVRIEWYKKGGVFDEPSVIGIGEASREAAIPLEGRYMLPFAKAIAEQMDGVRGSGSVLNNYFTINKADDPDAVAKAITRELSLQLRSV